MWLLVRNGPERYPFFLLTSYTVHLQGTKDPIHIISLTYNISFEALAEKIYLFAVTISCPFVVLKQLHQKHRSKPVKKLTTIRMTGLKQVDEHLKATIGTIVEAVRARQNVSQSLFELRAECGLPVTANIKQCLRVLLLRLASCSDVTKCEMSADNVVSCLT